MAFFEKKNKEKVLYDLVIKDAVKSYPLTGMEDKKLLAYDKIGSIFKKDVLELIKGCHKEEVKDVMVAINKQVERCQSI